MSERKTHRKGVENDGGAEKAKSAARLAAEKKKREEAARIDALISELPELYKCTKCGKSRKTDGRVLFRWNKRDI